MSNILSETMKLKVLSFPEYSQGANKIRVRLKDGRVYTSVFVAWGNEVVKVGSSNVIPFDAEDVINVENDVK